MNLDAVVAAHKVWLEVKYPMHFKEFCGRLGADPEAARAEASVCSFIRKMGFQTRPGEVIGVGGVDFICSAPPMDLVVEVTHIDPDAVSKRSGLPNEPKYEASSFSYITKAVIGKIRGKAGQVGGKPFPRLVFLTSEHEWGELMFSTIAIREAMVGGTLVTAEGLLRPSQKHAPFHSYEPDGTVKAQRCSISGVIVAAIHSDTMSMMGMLHPEPAAAISHEVFPDIPFCRIANWPSPLVRTDWVIGNPHPQRYYHQTIAISDAELKGNK